MNFNDCYNTCETILLEGALGVRLRGEFGLMPDKNVANASFVYQDYSREAMREIYYQYIAIANKYKLPIMLTTPTRRANKSNVERSEYGKDIIRDNVDFLKELREQKHSNHCVIESEAQHSNIYIGALMGCKGDAYKASEVLSTEEAYEFHSWQAELFRKEKVDFLFAGIMPAMPEIIGMAKAMGDTGIPYIISLMIRDNGRLIDGTTIHDAIKTIEETTTVKPISYMTNCVHPTNLGRALSQKFNQTELVKTHFKGIQANASPLSPEELDHSCETKSSDPVELAEEMLKLSDQFNLKIYGGCCGTNQMHMEELAKRLSNLR